MSTGCDSLSWTNLSHAMTLIDRQLLKADRKTLRDFGLLIGGILCALAAWFLFRHKAYALPVLYVGVPLFLLGAVLPTSLKYVYFGWMTLGNLLGTIVSSILLIIVYLFVLTPIGLLARLSGKDFLHKKWPVAESTAWIAYPKEPKTRADYERQF